MDGSKVSNYSKEDGKKEVRRKCRKKLHFFVASYSGTEFPLFAVKEKKERRKRSQGFCSAAFLLPY